MWQPAADPFAAVFGADAVLLLTEWQQFRQLAWLGTRETTEALQVSTDVLWRGRDGEGWQVSVGGALKPITGSKGCSRARRI